MTRNALDFKELSEEFWVVLLRQLRVPEGVHQIWLKNRSKLLRDEVLYHHERYGIDASFSNLLLIFNSHISQKDLFDLYIMQQRPNFKLLLSYVDKNREYDFQTFSSATSFYLDNRDPKYLQTLDETLKGKALEEWHGYANTIQTYNIFDDNSYESVKKSLTRAFKLAKLMQPNFSATFPKYI